MTTDQLVLQEVQRLSPTLQQRVLAFARALASPLPPGTSPDTLMQFAGTIPLEDLAAMEAAIEEDSGKVDPNDW